MSRKYTQEFRDQASNLVLVEKQTIRQTSQQLGISYHTLNGWLEKRREEARAAARPESSAQSEDPIVLKSRIRELETRLRRAEMSVDILKKATAYFASQSL
jgi:transposase